MAANPTPTTKRRPPASWDSIERRLADVILAAAKSRPEDRTRPLLRLLLSDAKTRCRQNAGRY